MVGTGTLIAVLIPISFFALVGFAISLGVRARSRSAELQAETVRRLIDKLGTSQEAMAYLESESGQRLLDSIAMPSRANPYRRILTAVATGAVLGCLGVGLLILDALFPGEESLRGAVVLLALAAGFLIAAGATYRLSKSWGLLDPDTASTTRLPAGPVA